MRRATADGWRANEHLLATLLPLLHLYVALRLRFAALAATAATLVITQLACGDDLPEDPPPAAVHAAASTCAAFDQRRGLARPVRAFPELTFEVPVQFVPDPVTAKAYVVELGGTIRRFDAHPGAATSEVVLDLSDVMLRVGNEDGLLGMAIERRDDDMALVVKYTAARTDGEKGVRLVVARVRSDDGGRTFRHDSLEEIFDVPRATAIHHGGPPGFGPDGMLYVPFGDGTWDGVRPSQDLSNLGGKIVRVDVRTRPFAIPSDNPFVARLDARPEIWAYGFRNPHGWSFDPDDGSLWVGDVGFGAWEELNHVFAGQNHGWPVREGAHCTMEPCDATGLVDPVYEYPTTGGAAILGGPVYRGRKLPALVGRVLVADYLSGRIEAIARTRGAPDPILLDETGFVLTSFSADGDGEPILTEISGRLWTLEPRPAGNVVPGRLSETGCVDPRAPATAPSGLLPYDVNMPLWSDGTDKARWLSLPANTKMRVLEDYSLEAPVGTVAVKTFFWGGRPIETRLFVRHVDGDWGGYSYAWRKDGSDADLLEHTRVEDVGGLVWTYPSRSQCLSCHTESAGRTLGLDLQQMNGSPELDRLAALDVFDPPLRDLGALPRFPRRDDVDAPDGEWARAYLHANCSHCHRPAAGGRGGTDLLANAPLSSAGCDRAPEVDDLGIDDARVIAPGSPNSSLLFRRMSARDGAQMPPLGTTKADELALARFRAWIGGMTACELEP